MAGGDILIDRPIYPSFGDSNQSLISLPVKKDEIKNKLGASQSAQTITLVALNQLFDPKTRGNNLHKQKNFNPVGLKQQIPYATVEDNIVYYLKNPGKFPSDSDEFKSIKQKIKDHLRTDPPVNTRDAFIYASYLYLSSQEFSQADKDQLAPKQIYDLIIEKTAKVIRLYHQEEIELIRKDMFSGKLYAPSLPQKDLAVLAKNFKFVPDGKGFMPKLEIKSKSDATKITATITLPTLVIDNPNPTLEDLQNILANHFHEISQINLRIMDKQQELKQLQHSHRSICLSGDAEKIPYYRNAITQVKNELATLEAEKKQRGLYYNFESPPQSRTELLDSLEVLSQLNLTALCEKIDIDDRFFSSTASDFDISFLIAAFKVFGVPWKSSRFTSLKGKAWEATDDEVHLHHLNEIEAEYKKRLKPRLRQTLFERIFGSPYESPLHSFSAFGNPDNTQQPDPLVELSPEAVSIVAYVEIVKDLLPGNTDSITLLGINHAYSNILNSQLLTQSIINQGQRSEQAFLLKNFNEPMGPEVSQLLLAELSVPQQQIAKIQQIATNLFFSHQTRIKPRFAREFFNLFHQVQKNGAVLTKKLTALYLRRKRLISQGAVTDSIDNEIIKLTKQLQKETQALDKRLKDQKSKYAKYSLSSFTNLIDELTKLHEHNKKTSSAKDSQIIVGMEGENEGENVSLAHVDVSHCQHVQATSAELTQQMAILSAFYQQNPHKMTPTLYQQKMQELFATMQSTAAANVSYHKETIAKCANATDTQQKTMLQQNETKWKNVKDEISEYQVKQKRSVVANFVALHPAYTQENIAAVGADGLPILIKNSSQKLGNSARICKTASKYIVVAEPKDYFSEEYGVATLLAEVYNGNKMPYQPPHIHNKVIQAKPNAISKHFKFLRDRDTKDKLKSHIDRTALHEAQKIFLAYPELTKKELEERLRTGDLQPLFGNKYQTLLSGMTVEEFYILSVIEYYPNGYWHLENANGKPNGCFNEANLRQTDYEEKLGPEQKIKIGASASNSSMFATPDENKQSSDENGTNVTPPPNPSK